MKSNTNAFKRRLVGCTLLTTFILAIAFLSLASGWQETIHGFFLTTSTTPFLAIIIGLLHITIYYGCKDDYSFIVGAGFLGAAFFDQYYVIINADLTGTDWSIESAAAWCWFSARLFLGLMLGMGLIYRNCSTGTFHHEAQFPNWVIQNKNNVIMGAFALLAAPLLATHLLPGTLLPSKHFLWAPEIMATTLFFFVLRGHYTHSPWKLNPFDSWMLISMIAFTLAGFMSLIFTFYPVFKTLLGAEITEYIGYICSLIGVILSIYAHFRKQCENEVQLLKAGEEAKNTLAEINTYRMALEEHAIVATTNSRGRITYASDKFCEISKYHREELLGQDHRLLNSMQQPKSFFNDLWKTISSGHVWHGEIQNRSKDGSCYWVDTSIIPFKDARGKVSKYIAVCTDVTRFKQTLLTVKRHKENQNVINDLLQMSLSEMYLQEILECSLKNLLSVSWLSTLPQGGIFLADEEAQTLTLTAHIDLSPEIQKLCSKIKFGQCLCGRAAQSQKLQFANCVDTRHEVRFEGMKPHGHYNVPIVKEGRVLGVLVLYLPHDSAFNAEQARFLTAVADVLAMVIDGKHRELQLREAKRKAEDATQAKSTFLASMSHEIRTPMNGVLGMLYCLTETKLQGEQIKFADTAKQSAHALLALIDDILDYSKIEAGKIELENITFNPLDLIDNVISTLTPKASEKNLVLRAEMDRVFPYLVTGDPNRLRQILFNLLGNAVKFTDQGSVVLQYTAQPSSEGYSLLKFDITDTGIGIPTEALSTLFTRFTQVDDSTTRRYGGTGLGLAISQDLAQLMGGEIGVKSTPGQGSTFWFTIRCEPVALTETRTTSDRTEMSQPLPPSLRILVAEDHRVNQIVIRTILEKAGHNVTIVTDGLEVVKAASSDMYDLILMDIQMPKLDGQEATRRIRALKTRAATIPIIALTADVLPEQRARFMAAGMNKHIAKPINPQSLFETITQVMANATQHKATHALIYPSDSQIHL